MKERRKERLINTLMQKLIIREEVKSRKVTESKRKTYLSTTSTKRSERLSTRKYLDNQKRRNVTYQLCSEKENRGGVTLKMNTINRVQY